MISDSGHIVARARSYADIAKTPEGKEWRARWETYWQEKLDAMTMNQSLKP